MGGRVFWVGPWGPPPPPAPNPAVLFLISDIPDHHLDVKAIQQLRKPGAPVVITAAAREKVPDGIVLANGGSLTAAGIQVEAVAAYDIKPGAPEHPKGKSNGYVITLGGKRLYLMGVTECVPEARGVKNVDVAFVPMNIPPGRMTPSEAVACVKAIQPKIVYLYHYDQEYAAKVANPNARSQGPAEGLSVADTVRTFRDMLNGGPTEFRDGNWYPPR